MRLKRCEEGWDRRDHLVEQGSRDAGLRIPQHGERRGEGGLVRGRQQSQPARARRDVGQRHHHAHAEHAARRVVVPVPEPAALATPAAAHQLRGVGVRSGQLREEPRRNVEAIVVPEQLVQHGAQSRAGRPGIGSGGGGGHLGG